MAIFDPDLSNLAQLVMSRANATIDLMCQHDPMWNSEAVQMSGVQRDHLNREVQPLNISGFGEALATLALRVANMAIFDPDLSNLAQLVMSRANATIDLMCQHDPMWNSEAVQMSGVQRDHLNREVRLYL
ncbi:uncharacterized [Tachysurus ichikawai]